MRFLWVLLLFGIGMTGGADDRGVEMTPPGHCCRICGRVCGCSLTPACEPGQSPFHPSCTKLDDRGARIGSLPARARAAGPAKSAGRLEFEAARSSSSGRDSRREPAASNEPDTRAPQAETTEVDFGTKTETPPTEQRPRPAPPVLLLGPGGVAPSVFK